MKKRLISIIIPAYNVEKYLSICLTSIIRQNTMELEILVIDDGSTDNTSKIATNYQTKYSNIRVITQRNQGVSQARNTGIKEACGEYLFFIDADDQLLPNAIKKIKEKISAVNSDTIMINYQLADENGNIISKSELRFFEEDFPVNPVSGHEALKLLFEMKISHWSWEVISKKDVYLENEVFFPVGQRYGEDFRTTFRILFFSDRVSFIHDYIYQYAQVSNSAMHTPRLSDSVDYMSTIAIIDKFVKKNIPEYSQLSIGYEIPRLINAYSITCKNKETTVEVVKLRTEIKRLLFIKLKQIKNWGTVSIRDRVKIVLIRFNLLSSIYKIYFRR